MLQMLREALHNVQKHAGATRVAVAMEKTDRGLEISVDDNGHGFRFAGTYTLEELELLRLGPASLKRRARSLNADLLLESRPGRGAGSEVPDPAADDDCAAALLAALSPSCSLGCGAVCRFHAASAQRAARNLSTFTFERPA